VGEFGYDGEGWGLASCDGEFYRSDGTAVVWRHDPATFAVGGRLEVTRREAPVAYLNELECTPRGLLANVWQSDEIVRIDPRTGRVTATIDAAGLLEAGERRPEGVLNGIAYRAETDTLLLTGKYWPWLFEVVLEEDQP
jgi:glutamine cyclotransferase